jgi:NADH dehydrogenase FAD-containing subunit
MSRGTARLLLIGGGYAHLQVLEAAAHNRIVPGAVTLVSPHPRQLYSGMVPGYLAGRYTIDEVTVDLPAVMRRIGGQFREAAVRQLDPAARTVTLHDGTTLPWDVASVAIGDLPAGAAIPGVQEHTQRVKPINRLLELGAALDAAAQAAGPEPLQIMVAGAGGSGFELALAVRARLDRLGANRAIISLVDSSHTPLRDRGLATRNDAEIALRRGEITLRLSTAVDEVGADHVRLTGGRVIPVDLVIWAVGSEGPPLFRASPLATDARGFLTVGDTLAVPGCPGLFGAGDAVSIQGSSRASPSGVSIRRQGSVLAHNLGLAITRVDALPGASLAGSYSAYLPRPQTLSLLDCSNGTAIFSYSGFVTTAAWARWLKESIDRRSIRRFQRLYS